MKMELGIIIYTKSRYDLTVIAIRDRRQIRICLVRIAQVFSSEIANCFLLLR